MDGMRGSASQKSDGDGEYTQNGLRFSDAVESRKWETNRVTIIRTTNWNTIARGRTRWRRGQEESRDLNLSRTYSKNSIHDRTDIGTHSHE